MTLVTATAADVFFLSVFLGVGTGFRLPVVAHPPWRRSRGDLPPLPDPKVLIRRSSSSILLPEEMAAPLPPPPPPFEVIILL